MSEVPELFEGAPVPGTLAANWDQPEAFWWREGVAARKNFSSFDVIKAVLEESMPARVVKVLDYAAERGWQPVNPAASLVVRFTREDALPFFAVWWMSVSPEGKRSWRFNGAYAQNGQGLNYGDIFVYLDDPSVIFPEPPEEPKPEMRPSSEATWGPTPKPDYGKAK